MTWLSHFQRRLDDETAWTEGFTEEEVMGKHTPDAFSNNAQALGNPSQGTGKHSAGSAHQSGQAQQPVSKPTK